MRLFFINHSCLVIRSKRSSLVPVRPLSDGSPDLELRRVTREVDAILPIGLSLPQAQ
jgi:hypothetical protein